MERDHVAKLISVTYKTDALKQKIPDEKSREVFCTVSSIQQSEFFAAGNRGLRPQMRLKVFAEDYQREEIAEVDGVRYRIYRTYLGDNEQLELYLEKKAGA